MKNEEKQLFKQLCRFRAKDFDKEGLAHATAAVLGQLFFNRMQGAAYGVLKQNGGLGAVNREFRHALKGAYEQNVQKNNAYFRCVDQMKEVLHAYQDRYVMLKGALLCRTYPEGYRTANDIDLLVRPQDVTMIGEALQKAGFRQGHIRGGAFIPANRSEIIASKMLRGETVPYIFEIGLPHMPYIEVDVNFSLDYKNGPTELLNSMLCDSIVMNDMPVFNKSDFFIHLCCHLYKEAAALPWVAMKRDMTLYKYADIYMLLDEMSDDERSRMAKRAEKLGLAKVCAFAIMQTADLFDAAWPSLFKWCRDMLQGDELFLHRVISPSDRRWYVYKNKDITARFFMNDRAADLEEVQPSCIS